MSDLKQLSGAIEAILFAYAEPVAPQKLAEILDIDVQLAQRLLEQLADRLDEQDRGLQLLKLNNHYQLATKAAHGELIKKALDTRRNTPLTQAALEVLAVIAYNQPVSRSFVEQVRGVDSSGVISTLSNKGLIEEAGRLELPGRPISYKTTDVFLRTFGIENLQQLPSLHSDDYMLTDENGEAVFDASFN